MNALNVNGNWHNLVIDACDIPMWDRSAEKWRSNDGKWHSLSATELRMLEDRLTTLDTISKLGFDRKWMIVATGLDFIKDILSSPALSSKHDEITTCAWDLMFNLISENSENQRKIWKECNELFLNCLQQDFCKKDTCRLVIYNIYARSDEGLDEGMTILTTLLNSFQHEKQSEPLEEQGLTMFLEHFITEESNISAMYLQLSNIEKMTLLQFTIDHLRREEGNGVKDSISMALLHRICDDFTSKSEHTFHASITDDIHLRELFALFEVIAAVSHEETYEFNRYNFELVLNVGRLLSYTIANEEKAERTFSAVKRNCDRPLRLVILTTISNLIKGNNGHKERARHNGLIDSLVDFITAKGIDMMTYRYTIFALIDICQTNPSNMEYVEQIVKNKDHNGSEFFRTLLMDIKWKGTRQ